jgi:hypothetical protein
MWKCPQCGQEFARNNQQHSCNESTLDDFLRGKSEQTTLLFWHFVKCFQKVGKVTIHPTKSMIAVASTTRIAYVIQLGKNFVDVVFPFDKPYEDNLCFRKIAQVPGTQQFNHHLRIMRREDVNKEVQHFMKLAYELSTPSTLKGENRMKGK